MNGDFDSILDKAGTEVSDEAAHFPQGTYLLRCTGVAFGGFTDNDTGREIEQVSFSYAVGSPQDDVDSDEFAAVAEEIDGQRIWKRIRLQNSEDRAALKRAIRAHGVNPDDVATYPTIRDAAKACKSTEVLGYVTLRTFRTKSGEDRTQNEVRSLTPASTLLDEAA